MTLPDFLIIGATKREEFRDGIGKTSALIGRPLSHWIV